MGNALFIIWRESAEAMLVVGILYAWLRKHPDVKRAMRYLWERMKIVVEPTGALGAAGLFERGFPVAGKRVGVILSGGNVDLKLVSRFFT